MQHDSKSQQIGLPELKTLALNLRKMTTGTSDAHIASYVSTSSLGVQVGRSLRLKHATLKILKNYPKDKNFNSSEVQEVLQEVFTSCGLTCPANLNYPETMIGYK